jgi:hypothetical protein
MPPAHFAYHPCQSLKRATYEPRKVNDSVPKTTTRDTAQKNAQHYFRNAELQPDTVAKKQQKKERVASAANTARLRELRLAKEAAEKQAHEAAGTDPAKKRKPARAKSVVRMSY